MRAKLINESHLGSLSQEEYNEEVMKSIRTGFFASLGDFQPLKVKSMTPDPNTLPGNEDDYMVLYKVTSAGDLIDAYRDEEISLSDITYDLEEQLDDFGTLNEAPYDIGEIKKIINIDEENDTVKLIMSLTASPIPDET